MSYSTLPAPSDLFGVNSALRSRSFPLGTDHRRDSSDSHSPMSEPRSPLFRPSLPAEIPPHIASLYNSPYAAAAVAAAVAGQGTGVTAASPFGAYSRPGAASFYPSMIAGEAWRRSPYMSQLDLWPHLRSLEAVVGPRTKAPREATSILKSWLNEHKDNPYPTKSEKMTLSLVTHMTLTQVSTWFANARRRIKKENKMTWTPKTRCGERDGSSSNEEESEKDYYGRHRSPFALPDQRESGIRLPSAEVDESKRTPNFEQPASRVFQHDATRKTAHPFFAAFAGFHSKYNNQSGAALQDMIKHSMARRESQEFAKPTSEATKSDLKSPSEKDEKREIPSPSKFPHLNKEQFPLMNNADQRPDLSFEQNTPFVRLNTEGREAQDSDDEREVDCEEIAPAKSDTNNKIEESSKDVMSNDDSGPATPNPEESSNSTTGPGFFRPPFMPGDMTSNSAANMDALSTWFREFQRLVSSGKEFEAKQALATALAVAAKAGAYSGLNAPAPFSTLVPQRGETSYPAEASEVGSIKPRSPNRGYRFSPLNSSRSHRTSSSDDIIALSPESTHRESTSPGPQYSHSGHRLPSDESPMNLSKPQTKAWTPEKLSSDAPVEA